MNTRYSGTYDYVVCPGKRFGSRINVCGHRATGAVEALTRLDEARDRPIADCLDRLWPKRAHTLSSTLRLDHRAAITVSNEDAGTVLCREYPLGRRNIFSERRKRFLHQGDALPYKRAVLAVQ
jgi:hypothetical protein